jgi:HK97 family phage prohead protease
MPKLIDKRIEAFRKAEMPMNYRSFAIKGGKGEEITKLGLKDRVVKGYAAIWGSLNDRQERFVKGAFAKSITENGPASNNTYEIKFRERHGKTCSLFAELKEDDIGLYFETKPLDKVQWADDLLVQLESGSMNSFSIGFKYIWDKVEWDDEKDCLVIIECRLFEISAVDLPSDPNTFQVRASEEEIEYLQDDVEDFIELLPKSRRLDARRLFTRCISLTTQEPLEEIRQALKEKEKPKKAEVDISLLINKTTFS